MLTYQDIKLKNLENSPKEIKKEKELVSQITRKKYKEKIFFYDNEFIVQKDHNEEMEETIDFYTGERIIPNRYDTKVSCCWAKEWHERNKIEIPSKYKKIIDKTSKKEIFLKELTDCLLGSTRKNFLDILSYYYDLNKPNKSISRLITILNKCNQLNVFIKMINTGTVEFYSPDLKIKKTLSMHKESAGGNQVFYNFSKNATDLTRNFSFPEYSLKLFIKYIKQVSC